MAAITMMSEDRAYLTPEDHHALNLFAYAIGEGELVLAVAWHNGGWQGILEFFPAGSDQDTHVTEEWLSDAGPCKTVAELLAELFGNRGKAH